MGMVPAVVLALLEVLCPTGGCTSRVPAWGQNLWRGQPWQPTASSGTSSGTPW